MSVGKGSTTDITMILDRSGSMANIASDTIGGVNTFLVDQQHAPGEATFTLVQFDDQYDVIYNAVPIARAAPLTTKTFVPRGSTALLDAIGRTIDATGARLAALAASQRPADVICVIVTDGYENASRLFSRQQVFDKISHQRDIYQWVFVFLGANQDAIASASSLGINQAAALTYAATPQGVASTYCIASDQLRSVRAGVTANVAFSKEDRVKAADGVVDGATSSPTDATTSSTVNPL